MVRFFTIFGEILEISLYLKVKLDGLPIPILVYMLVKGPKINLNM